MGCEQPAVPPSEVLAALQAVGLPHYYGLVAHCSVGMIKQGGRHFLMTRGFKMGHAVRLLLELGVSKYAVPEPDTTEAEKEAAKADDEKRTPPVLPADEPHGDTQVRDEVPQRDEVSGAGVQTALHEPTPVPPAQTNGVHPHPSSTVEAAAPGQTAAQQQPHTQEAQAVPQQAQVVQSPAEPMVPQQAQVVPQQAAPQQVVQQSPAVPQQAVPQQVAPQVVQQSPAVPQQAAPQQVAQQSPAVPQQAVPQQAAPQQVAPQQAVQQTPAVPQQVVQQSPAVPHQAVAQQAHVAPQQPPAALQQAAPQPAAPQQIVPQQAVPQQAVQQSPAVPQQAAQHTVQLPGTDFPILARGINECEESTRTIETCTVGK